jgi:hypothetical protein
VPRTPIAGRPARNLPPKLPDLAVVALAIALAREERARRWQQAMADFEAEIEQEAREKYGRRPDLDAICSRCRRDGIAGTPATDGATFAYRVPPRRNRKGRQVRKAVTVHHCAFHGGEVEPWYPAETAATVTAAA